MNSITKEIDAEASNVLSDAAEIVKARGLWQSDHRPNGRTVSMMGAIELATFGDMDDERDGRRSPLWVAVISKMSEYLFDCAPWPHRICSRFECACGMPHATAPMLLDEWSDYTARLPETVIMALNAAASS